MKHLTILGAGLSGLSCAYHFTGKSTVYEAKNSFGGTASSFSWQGFTFDYGPHLSFTKDEYVQGLFAKAVEGEYLTQAASNSNYSKGTWVRHPAICNLCDFSPTVNRDALLSFLETKESDVSEINNYKEWCELAQGKYFAENFTHIYTKKFWTVAPEEMTYQWAGERVAKPNLKRVIDGALGLQKDAGNYFTQFRYPKIGGYGAYSNFWEDAKERTNLKLNHQVTQIDLKRRVLSFANQPDAEFGDLLVSSVPLPEFVKLTTDVPEAVKQAVSKLRCTSVAFINIALQEPAKLPYHWFYIYDLDILPARCTFYSNISPWNAPEACTALQAEVPHSSSRPLPFEDLTEKVVSDLDKCGILESKNVLHCWQINLKYGYVIHDFARENALQVIHSWMRENGVEPVGRFGLWQYLWSDQAVKSGKKLAGILDNQME
jgi:protoporphyrinogen oxidase